VYYQQTLCWGNCASATAPSGSPGPGRNWAPTGEQLIIKLLLAAVAASALVVAPQAHADPTMTVGQICAESAPGYIPMTVVAAPELSCGDPNYWRSTGTVPGLFIAPPPSISRVMDRIHPGSYPVDPANPWSDWVVQPGPPRAQVRAPEVACDEVYPGGPIHCGPDVPIPCNGPGSPC
jgi:hypothetical protein